MLKSWITAIYITTGAPNKDTIDIANELELIEVEKL
jgi:hypothetical protein